jgi:hypothetical protein
MALNRVRALGSGAVIGYQGCDGRGSADPAYALFFEIDGERIVVHGIDEESRRSLGAIRDTCFYATAGLTLLDCRDGEYQFTGTRCRHCQRPMIKRAACEWKTCDDCAATCTHEYALGIIHGGRIDIGVGNACKKCDRVKPDNPEMSLDYHHRFVEGLLAMHGIGAVVLGERP